MISGFGKIASIYIPSPPVSAADEKCWGTPDMSYEVAHTSRGALDAVNAQSHTEAGSSGGRHSLSAVVPPSEIKTALLPRIYLEMWAVPYHGEEALSRPCRPRDGRDLSGNRAGQSPFEIHVFA